MSLSEAILLVFKLLKAAHELHLGALNLPANSCEFVERLDEVEGHQT